MFYLILFIQLILSKIKSVNGYIDFIVYILRVLVPLWQQSIIIYFVSPPQKKAMSPDKIETHDHSYSC